MDLENVINETWISSRKSREEVIQWRRRDEQLLFKRARECLHSSLSSRAPQKSRCSTTTKTCSRGSRTHDPAKPGTSLCSTSCLCKKATMDRHTRDYVRVEKLETLEDTTDNRRQLFAVEIVLHLLALLGRTVLGVEAVQPNLIRDHRKIAEIRKGLA